jgi:5'-nucleotidase
MNRKIYLDLDGVMADFDTMFPNTFGLDHKQMGDDEMWNMINSHSSYFRDMPILTEQKSFGKTS